MADRLPQLLRTHHAALKTAWLRRLRACPPVSAMARVEILAHYMDDTLRQLGCLLNSRPLQGAESRAVVSSALRRSQCPCGLNPLLDYYVTGDEALGAVLSNLSEEEREHVNQCWHRLAQGEIESLCNVCCRRSAACPTAVTAAEV